jgi:hypothetical protein
MVQIGAIFFCFFRLRFLTKRVRGGYENEKVGVSKYFEAGGFTNILPHGKANEYHCCGSKYFETFVFFFPQIFYPTVSECVIVF